MMVGVLKVSARTRLASFELVLEFAVASWCLQALKDVLLFGRKISLLGSSGVLILLL